MWPWEHVLFAYVFYSIFVHARYRTPPEDWPVVCLVAGSLLPDLVDKPLAWQFGVIDSGYAIAHSVFVAVPVSVAVYAVARRRGVGQTGVAFAFGYLLHLVGDVLPASLSRGEFYPEPMLWPVRPYQPSHDHGSFADGVYSLLSQYLLQLFSLELTPVVALQLGSVVFGVTLWMYDGRPGLGAVVTALHRVRSRFETK